MVGKRKNSSKPRENPKKTKLEENFENNIEIDIKNEENEIKNENDENLENDIEIDIKNEDINEIKNDENLENDEDIEFYGKPIPAAEAREKWPYRYRDFFKGKRDDQTGSKSSTSDNSSEEFIQALQHFTKAKDGLVTYNLGDDAHVQAEEGKDSYICKIVEMFKATDGSSYFRAQWYYRAKDTAIKECSELIDNKRVFISEVKDDNPLGCLLKKLKILRLPLNMDALERETTLNCDFYCDMMYHVPYSTFMKLPTPIVNVPAILESNSTISSEVDTVEATNGTKSDSEDVSQVGFTKTTEMTLLDLYSGCGGMSTGLSLGANGVGVNLVTKWAVDMNKYACESLQYNHPETHVRNESADDFLGLLKKWSELCDRFVKNDNVPETVDSIEAEDDEASDDADADDGGDDGEVYEVEKILDIQYSDKKGTGEPELLFKIRWKNYGPADDTWEPIEGLSDCQDRLKEFVVNGYNAKILPLPGNTDVICGGPPCQGISGYNRFRDVTEPFKDEKNRQLLVYMNIIEYLKPKFILMENVVDILKFAGGLLGRYALGRLVGMGYQTRVGMMAAGSYGLPQFRMRVFLWGASPSEKLPQYPLPTYHCIYKGAVPTEFDMCYVQYSKETNVELEKSLFLGDAISDLPPVENNEERDEMPYGGEPQTDFQKFIRLPKNGDSKHLLFDHRPLQLNDDDYARVCQIPKEKGANFRKLKGVMVVGDKVEWDPNVERVYLPSGKPLVPNYAMSYKLGKSPKPFKRLWWDETVPTVITRAEPHNHPILHPLQDRVLSVRENARLQGFPDHYKLFGEIKDRYIQIGNAVAVPVSRALGYSLGLAMQGIWSEEPLITLPKKFPIILEVDPQAVEESNLS